MDTRRTPEGHGTPEFRYLSPREIDHHMRRAMRMRAEVAIRTGKEAGNSSNLSSSSLLTGRSLAIFFSVT